MKLIQLNDILGYFISLGSDVHFAAFLLLLSIFYIFAYGFFVKVYKVTMAYLKKAKEAFKELITPAPDEDVDEDGNVYRGE